MMLPLKRILILDCSFKALFVVIAEALKTRMPIADKKILFIGLIFRLGFYKGSCFFAKKIKFYINARVL